MAFANLTDTAIILQNMGLKFFFFPAGLPKKQDSAPEIGPKSAPGQSPHSQFGKQKINRTVENGKHGEPDRENIGKTISFWRPTPREEWPEEWQNLLKNTRRGLICWTYSRLGHDLLQAKSGNEDKGIVERRKLLACLIRDFGLPAGTHTFWPCRLDNSQSTTGQDREIFWSGLNYLGCRGLVFMDYKAAEYLLEIPSPAIPFKLLPVFHGMKIWIIKGIDELLASPTHYNSSVNYLKREFQKLPFSKQAG